MRCDFCNKKILHDYICYCGNVHCIQHKQPENHECPVNWFNLHKILLLFKL